METLSEEEKATKDAPSNPSDGPVQSNVQEGVSGADVEKPESERKSTSKRSGLSELAKQLRLLQAKNQAQATEIDRLERQLKILADLQNVSVADIKNALTAACQAEAHSELQNRIAFLSAQLEAAELAKKSATRSASADDRVANLQLRIGELEEVEENAQAEIQRLYKALSEQTEKATRLEAACAKQQAEIEKLKSSDVGQAVSDEVHHEQVSDVERRQKVEEQVEREQKVLLEKQLSAAEKQHELRRAQFETRFKVQEENIHDLKQQLISLYTAFDMLRQEREEDQKVSAALRTNLHSADEKVAQQTSDLEKQAPSLVHRSPPSSPSSPSKSPPPIAKGAVVSPGPPSPPPHSTKESAESPSPRTPRREKVMAGDVLLRTGLIKRWKKRRACLYLKFTHYDLVFFEDAVSPNPKLSLSLVAGVASVRPFPNQQFAISVLTNTFDQTAGKEAVFSASNEEEYDRWMAALRPATAGAEAATEFHEQPSESHRQQISAAEQEALDLEMALELSERDL